MQWFTNLSTRKRVIVGVIFLVLFCSCAALGTNALAGLGNSPADATPTGAAVVQMAVQATDTPAPRSTDTPEPTVAPPTWVTVAKFNGSNNKQTDTFPLQDGDHIVWKENPTDQANFFAITLYDGSGNYIDLIANNANISGHTGETYTVQGFGAGDAYLKIEADSVNYSVTIQDLQ